MNDGSSSPWVYDKSNYHTATLGYPKTELHNLTKTDVNPFLWMWGKCTEVINLLGNALENFQIFTQQIKVV
jgi:hypothetical protein